MGTIIRVRNEDGSIIEVPAFKGNDGQSGTITDVSATIDNTSGEPTVEVALGGTELARTIAFAFTGLKGPKGDEGGTPIVATTEDPGAGTAVEYADGTVIHVYE